MPTDVERPWLRHYAPGVAPDIELPTGSLVDLLDTAVTTFGDRVALEFFGAEVTYTELGRRVAHAAEGLRAEAADLDVVLEDREGLRQLVRGRLERAGHRCRGRRPGGPGCSC